MKLSDFSIEALNSFITGDESPSPRMSGPDIIKFFNMFGVRDVYSFLSESVTYPTSIVLTTRD
jgi:hypothetical protein